MKISSSIAFFSNLLLSSFDRGSSFNSLPCYINHARSYHKTANLAASITSDDMATSSFGVKKLGESVAEGNIVSYFAGGLAAVKINVNALSTNPQREPEYNEKKPQQDNEQTGDDLVGRLAKLPNESLGVVVAQRPPLAFVYTQDSDLKDLDGSVEIMDSMAEVNVGNGMNVVNAFGQPAPTTGWGSRAIFSPIPKVSDISLINSPKLTGTTMVDVLAPIGKGQNMLLIGSDISQMRDVTSNFLKAQAKVENTQCIYAITQDREVVMDRLAKEGLLDSTIVVAARDNIESETARAAEAITVAGTACAIAESFAKDKSQDAVVIIDNLDYHKNLWDETTRILVDIYGIDAVVAADREGGASSEMRAFYSSLIQRAANYNQEQGGGSVTMALMTTIPEIKDEEDQVFSPEDFAMAGDKMKARINLLVEKNIPLTSSTLRKIQIPIPSAAEGKRRLSLQHVDDLISMSDGQIWLNDALLNDGQFPPVDPQRSITRVGIGADTKSRADAPAIRRIVEGVRLELQQAANMDGAEATVASKKQIRKGQAWYLAMDQDPVDGDRSLAETCVTLLAASTGALDEVVEKGCIAGSEAGRTKIKNLIEHVRLNAPDSMESINETFDLTPEIRKSLEDAISSFFQ